MKFNWKKIYFEEKQHVKKFYNLSRFLIAFIIFILLIVNLVFIQSIEKTVASFINDTGLETFRTKIFGTQQSYLDWLGGSSKQFALNGNVSISSTLSATFITFITAIAFMSLVIELILIASKPRTLLSLSAFVISVIFFIILIVGISLISYELYKFKPFNNLGQELNALKDSDLATRELVQLFNTTLIKMKGILGA